MRIERRISELKNTKFMLSNIVIMLLLLIVAGLNLIIPDKQMAENENRYLEQLPSFTLSSLMSGDFADNFKEYINDQFPFRDQLTGLRTKVKLLSGNTEINGVYVGADDYLIEAIKPWDIDNKRIQDNISAVNKFFADSGIDKSRCSVMVVPTVGYINSKLLPNFAPMVNQQDILDEIKTGIKGAEFIQISTALKELKEQTYYRTDHHWTSEAAYAAYKVWRDDDSAGSGLKKTVVSEDFRGTLYSKALTGTAKDVISIYSDGENPITICDGQEKNLFCKSALETKSKYEVFLGGNYSEVKISGKGEGILLIIKDSFANSFSQFAVDDYKEVRLIDLRYYNGSVKDYIRDNQVTEVLFLYGINTFITDANIDKLNN